MFINPYNVSKAYPIWLRKDPLGVEKNKQIAEAIVQQNYLTLENFGMVCTLYKKFTDREHCYCWDPTYQQANRKCEVCSGTGYLDGYRKYGYRENTYGINSLTTTTPRLIGSNYDTIGDVGKPKIAIVIKQGNSAWVETEYISLDQVKDMGYIKSGIYTPPNTSIVYKYTFNGSTYTTLNDLSNLSALNVAINGQTQIKFRIELNKLTSTAQSPGFIYIKIRMRVALKIGEINTRFTTIGIPAFLASKSFTPRSQELDEHGLIRAFPLSFWTLVDCKIDEHDIAKFLDGPYSGKPFETLNVRHSIFGGENKLLSARWDSRFIQGEGDSAGFAYLLD